MLRTDREGGGAAPAHARLGGSPNGALGFVGSEPLVVHRNRVPEQAKAYQ